MTLLERLERRRNLPADEQVSLEDVVTVVRQTMLDQYPDVVLAARRDNGQRGKLRELVDQLLAAHGLLVARLRRETLSDYLVQALVGYGPIDTLLDDDSVTEVMVNGPTEVYVEREGALQLTDIVFEDENHLIDLITRMIAPLGRRVDRSNPYVDGRLPDGSRLNAVLPPLALNGPVLTIRRFPNKMRFLKEMVAAGTLNQEMSAFIERAICARLNVVVSGGTSSGKTTTLGVLCSVVKKTERIICIEDSSEIRLPCRHMVNLETRLPNLEGKGAVTIRQLVRNALRMRPDRLVIGEVRGGEAFDLVQAMNTGHAGSMTTVHANSASDALKRLEGMVLTANEGLSISAVRQHLGAAIDIVIHQARTDKGQRRITELAVAEWSDAQEKTHLTTIYRDLNRGWHERGHFSTVGTIPTWLQEQLRTIENPSDVSDE